MRSEPAPPEAPREARLWEIVFPDHTNHLGTLFGGQALAWMDKAAFVAATRFARRTVVTARSEQVDFHVPVRQGQLVELVAVVESVGRSSMQVTVELQAEDRRQQGQRQSGDEPVRGHLTEHDETERLRREGELFERAVTVVVGEQARQ